MILSLIHISEPKEIINKYAKEGYSYVGFIPTLIDAHGGFRRDVYKRQVKSIGDYPSGCGSAWLERLVWDQEVAGSNPVTPTYAGDVYKRQVGYIR